MGEYEKPDGTADDPELIGLTYTSTSVGGNLVPDELSPEARRVAEELRRSYLPREPKVNPGPFTISHGLHRRLQKMPESVEKELDGILEEAWEEIKK